jgi:Peptidase family S41
MKNLLFLIGIFFISKLNAQNCNCDSAFLKTVEVIERNYGVFELIPNYKERKEYVNLKKDLIAKIKLNDKPCELYINQYINSFTDRHMSYSCSDSIKLPKYDSNKKIGENIKQNSKLLGLWQFRDFPSFYEFKSVNNVIIGKAVYDFGEVDASSNWVHIYCIYKKKQKKYELLFKEKHGPQGIYNLALQGNELIDKENGVVFTKRDTVRRFKYKRTKRPPIEAKKISNDFFYISVYDIYSTPKSYIDSILAANDSIILNTKNLILDFRDNGGGQTPPTFGLIKYLYTKPLQLSNTYYFASEKLINSTKEFCSSYDGNDPDIKNGYCTDLYNKLLNNRNKIVKDTSPLKIQDSIYKYPKNVAILVNGKTASAAEMAIDGFRKGSEKVKIFGMPSNGFMDSGVPWEFKICDNYTIYIPIQLLESMKTKGNSFTKLIPDVSLKQEEKTWIEQVMKYYETNN